MNINFSCSHLTVMAPFLNRGLLSLWSNVIIRIIGYVFHGFMVKSQYCLISLCAYAYNQASITCFWLHKLSIKFVNPARCLEGVLYSIFGDMYEIISSLLIVNLEVEPKRSKWIARSDFRCSMGEVRWKLDKILGAKPPPRYNQILVIKGHVITGLHCTFHKLKVTQMMVTQSFKDCNQALRL